MPKRRKALFGLWLGSCLLTLAGTLFASEPRLSQADLLRSAERAEGVPDPARAAYWYALARDSAPDSRLGRRAGARLDWLEARKEGEWQPLRELLRMRSFAGRGPAELAPMLEFERRLRAFPAGRVRRESWQLVAETYLHRQGEPERALAAYRAWLAEPGLDEAERQLAITGAAQARALLGDGRGSLEELAAAGLERRPEAVELRLRLLRASARPLAQGAVGVFVVLAFACGGFRGFFRPQLARALSVRRLALGTYLLFGPVVFALLHSYDVLRVVGPLSLSCAAICCLASIAGQGLDASRTARAPRAAITLLALLAQIGAGYLTLDGSGALLALLTSPAPR